MNNIIKIIMCFFGILSIYSVILMAINSTKKRKSIKIIKTITNKVEKNINKIQCVKRISNQIEYIKVGLKTNKKFKAFILIAFNKCTYIGLILSISFYISYYIYYHTKLITISISFFIFIVYILREMLTYLVYIKKRKIKESFLNYVINLKNYTLVDNDALKAILNTKPEKDIEEYILRFRVDILSGENVHNSFKKLKEDISIEDISNFFTYVEVCYINGGNINNVIDSYISIYQNKILRQTKEKEDISSTKVVIYVLFFIHIYLMFSYIFNNYEYLILIKNGIFGKVALNIGILSYILVFNNVIKSEMEE